jgi:hypothetical protein
MFQTKDLSAAQALVALRTGCDIYPIDGSENDTSSRIIMYDILKRCFIEYFSAARFADQWNTLQQKIPQFASKCEYYLYKSAANNMAVYQDIKTLQCRITEFRNRISTVACML